MTYAERLAEIERLKRDNPRILSIPLVSEGEISPAQIGLMSDRQRIAYRDNAQRRMVIESRIRELSQTDEQLAKQEQVECTKENQGRLLQLQRRIEDLTRIGIGKNGKIKPKYQRAIDEAQAEIQVLSKETIS